MSCDMCQGIGVIPCYVCDGDEIVAVKFRGPTALDDMARFVDDELALELDDESDPIAVIEDNRYAVLSWSETEITITIPCMECDGEGHLAECDECDAEWVLQPSEWAEVVA